MFLWLFPEESDVGLKFDKNLTQKKLDITQKKLDRAIKKRNAIYEANQVVLKAAAKAKEEVLKAAAKAKEEELERARERAKLMERWKSISEGSWSRELGPYSSEYNKKLHKEYEKLSEIYLPADIPLVDLKEINTKYPELTEDQSEEDYISNILDDWRKKYAVEAYRKRKQKERWEKGEQTAADVLEKAKEEEEEEARLRRMKQKEEDGNDDSDHDLEPFDDWN